MNVPMTTADVQSLLETLVHESSDITVESVGATAWGTTASFYMEGIAIDQSDVVPDGTANSIYVGEDDFVQSHLLRIEVEPGSGDEDDDGSAFPAAILVGIHTSGEYSDEDYQAGYSGSIHILSEGGSEADWRAAANAEHNAIMRRCVNDAIAQLERIVAEASDDALAGLAREPGMRNVMRRAAMAA